MRARALLVCSAAVAVGAVGIAPARGGLPIIFDQGPSTGELGTCWSNQAEDQNWADQATFADETIVQGIELYVLSDPGPVAVHVKILADDGAGNPGAPVHEEDLPGPFVEPIGGGLFRVAVALSEPFTAAAGTTYWYGLSGHVPFSFDVCTVLSPGDGRIAIFLGSEFLDHRDLGDQMFALLGEVVPVELQSFTVE